MNNKQNENPANNSDYTLAEMNNSIEFKQYADLIKAAMSLKENIPDIMDFPVKLPAFMLPA